MINQVSSWALCNVDLVESMLSCFPFAPILQNLESRVFGCFVFGRVHKQYQYQLDPHAVKCIFSGYAPNKRGYTCYHHSSQNFFVSKYVTFHENVSYFTCAWYHGENINDLESDSEFLTLSLHRAPIIVPTSKLELLPMLSHIANLISKYESKSVPNLQIVKPKLEYAIVLVLQCLISEINTFNTNSSVS